MPKVANGGPGLPAVSLHHCSTLSFQDHTSGDVAEADWRNGDSYRGSPTAAPNKVVLSALLDVIGEGNSASQTAVFLTGAGSGQCESLSSDRVKTPRQGDLTPLIPEIDLLGLAMPPMVPGSPQPEGRFGSCRGQSSPKLVA